MPKKSGRIKRPAVSLPQALGNDATAEIRQALKSRGPDASVTEVVAQLAAKGLKVSRTQVAAIKGALFENQKVSGRNTQPTAAVRARHAVAKKKSARAGAPKGQLKGRRASQAEETTSVKKKPVKRGRPVKNALRMPHA